MWKLLPKGKTPAVSIIQVFLTQELGFPVHYNVFLQQFYKRSSGFGCSLRNRKQFYLPWVKFSASPVPCTMEHTLSKDVKWEFPDMRHQLDERPPTKDQRVSRNLSKAPTLSQDITYQPQTASVLAYTADASFQNWQFDSILLQDLYAPAGVWDLIEANLRLKTASKAEFLFFQTF